MENEQKIGIVMTVIGSLLILILFYVQLLQPMIDTTLLTQMPKSQYWAMAIPMFFVSAGVLGTIAWIGFTMYMTPPPEVSEFEDFKKAPETKKAETKKKPAKAKKPAKKEEKKPEKKIEKKAEAKKEEPKKEEPKKEEVKAATSDYELTDIKGIGASTADTLRDEGFDTVEKIANADISEMTKIKGVGKATAQKYIDRAKELLES